MINCWLCGAPAKTQQGLTCHFRLKHPGEPVNNYDDLPEVDGIDDGLGEYQPGPVAMPGQEVLEQVLPSLAEFEDRLSGVEVQLEDYEEVAGRVEVVLAQTTRQGKELVRAIEDIGDLRETLGHTRVAFEASLVEVWAWIRKLDRELDNVQRAWDNQVLLSRARLREPVPTAGGKKSSNRL